MCFQNWPYWPYSTSLSNANLLDLTGCDSYDVPAPCSNGHFQDVTHSRGAGSWRSLLFLSLSAAHNDSGSGKATWHTLDISHGYSYHYYYYYYHWVRVIFLPLYSLIMAWFFFSLHLIKYPDTFRNNCGQWKESTSCDEVRHSDPSETEGWCVSP